MKKIITLLLICQSSMLFAQHLNYFRLNIGPKFENYNVAGSDEVNALLHLDAGASIYFGKLFTENIYAEAGLIKNDYSAKFDITTVGLGGQEYRWFDQDLYPTMKTTQASLSLGWRQPYSHKVSFYGSAGFQMFLSKKLSREGSQQHIRESIVDVDGQKESIEIYTFSNGFESGNLLLRADIGTLIQVSKTLWVNLGVTARSAVDPINEFQVEYTTLSNQANKTATLSTNGAGLVLNLGVKYQIAKFVK